MAKYITKPKIKEATQWFPDGPRIPGVGYFPKIEGSSIFGEAWYVTTIHGQRAWLVPGDYIVTEPDGIHHYPCKPDIFESSHDKLEENK